ncbi:hypothetical protein XENOCAPTIV_019836 [Xenoophorus captivus]|uniref:Ig-like domain-containing protein n=1 Tax=Xenoophorus captivus TaxID=1517983 RepID=A0ABV0RWN2_9TELE
MKVQRFEVHHNGTLIIRNSQLPDGGQYLCTVQNQYGEDKMMSNLVVLSHHPQVLQPQQRDIHVSEGGKVELECKVKGHPVSRVTWVLPNSVQMTPTSAPVPSRQRVVVDNIGTLRISQTIFTDSGIYRCLSSSAAGADTVSVGLHVSPKPRLIQQCQDENIILPEGSAAHINCTATRASLPVIRWITPDGTHLTAPQLHSGRSLIVFQNGTLHIQRLSPKNSGRYVFDPRINVFLNGSISIHSVTDKDTGGYLCVARNKMGNDYNQLGKDEMKMRVRVKGGTSPPHIQYKDQNTIRVLSGETATLQCNAMGDPLPVITWMSSQNRLISPDLDKYKVRKDGTLVVQKVQQFDGGNYTCMARNSFGQDNKVTTVEVLAAPLAINGLRGVSNTINVTVVQGERKMVDCETKGTSLSHHMWILPGNVILPVSYHSNHMRVHQNGTLEIRSAKKTDSGQMACVARNEGDEARMLVNLDVIETVERPQIKSPKAENLSLRMGNTVTLNCSIDGFKLAHLTWILPNGTLLHTGVRISKFFHQLDGSLIISNPSVAEAGVYRCVGHNSARLFESTITLSPGRKPQILNTYISPVSIMDGETLFLHCQTTGEPLRLTWTLPSGVFLNRLQKAGRYSILHNGTIVIRQASVYDRGSYVCRVANEYGSSLLSVSVNIITNQPRITIGPPSVTYAKHGVAVQLNCAATGIPKAEVAWETPDKTRMVVSAQPRLFGNKYLHPKGSLIIQDPTQQDSGVYRCTARNPAGVDSKTTFLNVF